VKVKRQQQQRRKRLDARPQEALLCAKAKRQRQMFSVAKAKRQLQCFICAKAKRQRQSELPGTEITSLNAPQHSQRFP